MLIIKKSKKQFNKKNKISKQIEVIPTLKKHDVIFDIVHLKKLLHSNNFMIDIPNYINKFFFKYGSKVFFDNGENFECLTIEDAKRKIPDEYSRNITTRIGDKSKTKEIRLNSYFTHEMFLSTHETTLTIDYNKDIKFQSIRHIRGFEQIYNCLNMKKDLPRDYTRKIEMNDFKKSGVEAFFNHIKLIICSSDQDEYDTTIKFLSSSIFGHKVKIALLWQSKEQTGKGTVLNYLNDLLGSRMYKTSDSEQVEKYTKAFEGCTLLNFDELPVFGTNKMLQDKMKAQITESEFDCRGMYQSGYSQKNTFNIIITSNNNCVNLTQTNNVRYYVNTINETFVGNNEYFNKIHKYLADEDIKVLIYQEFLKIYNEQVKPINWIGNNLKATKAGLIKRIDALPQFHKYIKENYLKWGFGIDELTSEFIAKYKQTDKYSSAHKIGSLLKEFGINIKKFNTNNELATYRKYIISFEDLRNFYS
jgi:hypothetical protein